MQYIIHTIALRTHTHTHRIIKLVRAIRKGWLKTEAQKERPEVCVCARVCVCVCWCVYTGDNRLGHERSVLPKQPACIQWITCAGAACVLDVGQRRASWKRGPCLTAPACTSLHAHNAPHPQEPPVYLMWGNDGLAGEEGSAKTATGLSYIPGAKPKLPGHAESYNPPAEYIPTEVGWTGVALCPCVCVLMRVRLCTLVCTPAALRGRLPVPLAWSKSLKV